LLDQDYQFENYPDALVPGSPLIAWNFAYRCFDYMYLVEKEPENSKLLEERMKLVSLPEKFRIYQKDANKVYSSIIEEIEETASAHFFAFIDPYAFEVEWKTLERLLTSRVRGDFLILFQPRYIAMNVGSVLSGRVKEHNALNKFFGDASWIDYLGKKRGAGQGIPEAALEYYVNKIKEVRKGRETIIEKVKIPLFDNTCYFLIFVTTRTMRGNPWMNTVIKLKNLIEKGNRRLVENAISCILGKQQSILSYL